MAGHPSGFARALTREWKLEVKHALYRLDGKWYHHLKEFPAALLDKNGYVRFETSEQYRHSPHLLIKQRVHVPSGISQMPTYVRVK